MIAGAGNYDELWAHIRMLEPAFQTSVKDLRYLDLHHQFHLNFHHLRPILTKFLPKWSKFQPIVYQSDQISTNSEPIWRIFDQIPIK